MDCFSVTLAGNDSRNHFELQHFLHDFCESSPSECFSFLSLGKLDHMVLSFGSTPSDLTECDLKVHTSPLVEHHNSHFGRLLHRSSEEQWAKTIGSNGVFGFSLLKLSNRFRSGFGEPEERDQLLIEALESGFEGLEMEWALGSTTGWEDYALLFFCREFQTLAKAIGIARGLSRRHLSRQLQLKTGGQNHWFLTTCTQPAMHFGGRLISDLLGEGVDRTELFESLGQAFDLASGLRWSVRFEIRPGHWDGVSDFIGKHSDGFEGAVLEKTFGQSDLRFSASEDSCLRSLMEFFLDVAYPLIAKRNFAVRGLDTHLHIPSFEYVEDIESGYYLSDPSSKREKNVTEFDDTLEVLCLDAGIPERTVNGLLRSFRKIESFLLHDLLEEDFYHVHEVFRRFLKGLKSTATQVTEGLVSLRDFQEYRDRFYDSISDWLYYFERCLADRYRGVYPAGEAVSMRIATYFSSHHKYLTIIDYFGNASTDLFYDLLSRSLGRQVNSDLSVASFLGSSPNISCIHGPLKLFGTSFVDLPEESVFHVSEFVTLAHEVGHHATLAFLEHGELPILGVDPKTRKARLSLLMQELRETRLYKCYSEDIDTYNNSEYSGSYRHLISEILADLFSFSLCSRGNLELHWDLTERSVKVLFPQGAAENGQRRVMHELVRATVLLRLLAAESIFSNVVRRVDVESTSRIFSSHFSYGKKLRALFSEFEKDGPVAQFSARLMVQTESALNVMELLMRKDRDFSKFVESICSLAHEDSFIGEGMEPVLSLYRRLLLNSKDRLLHGDWREVDKIFYSVHYNRSREALNPR